MTSAKCTRKSKRVKFEFWLDVYNDHQADLADQLAYLKLDRQYSRTLRDALTLLFDLQAGSTQVLHQMFPQLATTPASSDFQALLEKIDTLASRPAPAPPSALQPTFRPVTPAPDDDAIELDIKADKEAGKKAVANFMASMQALNPHLPKRTNDTIQPNGPRKLSGADVSFSAPNFNDEEDLDLLS